MPDPAATALTSAPAAPVAAPAVVTPAAAVAPAAPAATALTAPPASAAPLAPAAPSGVPAVAAGDQPKPVDPTAEIKYDLKVPEGSTLGAEDAAAVTAFAKEHKIAPEVAQKLLEREGAVVKSFMDAQVANFDAKKTEWVAALATDKEIGGVNQTASLEAAYKAVQRFGDAELTAELAKTGYGNWPPLVRFAARIGKAMSEGRIVNPPADGGPANPAHVLYPPAR